MFTGRSRRKQARFCESGASEACRVAQPVRRPPVCSRIRRRHPRSGECAPRRRAARARRAKFIGMGTRISVISFLLVGAAAAQAADADLDAAIARNRMGTLVIRTAPGAKVAVEQVRHEFWFGATLPAASSGRMTPGRHRQMEGDFRQPFQRRRAGSRLQVGRHGAPRKAR